MELDSRIVFYDPICPAPYSRATLQQRGLGGSEACVVRIAEALGACVMQHCRTTTDGIFRPPSSATNVEHVIVVRDARALHDVRLLFPTARLYVWLHDLAAPGSTRARWLTSSSKYLGGVTLVCVSDFLCARIAAVVDPLDMANEVDVRTIYNPIDDDLAAGAAAIDDDKLVFLSSPNKGLSYALTAFQAIRKVIPGLRLFVANPGYRIIESQAVPNVVWLGTLPFAQAVAHASSALGVLMPNILLPETFGLVFAESNAVGTPVITHDVGAAREVLHAANPVLPIRSRQKSFARLARQFGVRAPHFLSGVGLRLGVFDDYIETIRAWRNGQRPKVTAEPRFRLSFVAQQWRQLLS